MMDYISFCDIMNLKKRYNKKIQVEKFTTMLNKEGYTDDKIDKIIDYINNCLCDFCTEKNNVLYANEALCLRLLRKIWCTSKEKSRINHFIVKYVCEPNKKNRTALEDKLEEYKNDGCKFRKYCRLHLIAVLFRLEICGDNRVIINNEYYYLPCPYGDYRDIFCKKQELLYDEFNDIEFEVRI